MAKIKFLTLRTIKTQQTKLSMKKQLTYVLFCTFLAGSILSSCQKDEQSLSQNTFSANADNPNLSAEIKSFRENMIGTRKSGGSMSLNDAIWMMEAAFNYYHSFYHEEIEYTFTDSIVIPLSFSGLDKINIGEMSSIYKTINNALLKSFVNYPDENKIPYLFDLEIEATPTGNQLLVLSTIATKKTLKSGDNLDFDPFGSTDYWFPGTIYNDVAHRKGKCSSYTGQYVGIYDASSRLANRVLTYHGERSSYNISFTNIFTLNSVNPYGNLFAGDWETCISPYWMNSYYNEIVDKLASTKLLNPITDGKSLIGVYIFNDGTFYNDGTPGYSSYMYVAGFKFGTRVIRDDDEDDSVPFSLTLI